MVKNLSAVRETWLCSLGWDNPLEEGMATQSSILAWEIPWTEEPGRLHSIRSQRIRYERSDSECTHAVEEWRSEPRIFISQVSPRRK